MLGIIGGSGLGALPGIERARSETMPTPYGSPSAPLVSGLMHGCDVVFLARHGTGHLIPPHKVNYRANLWALHARGVRDLVSVAAVGGIRPDLTPGTLAVPDQIIDYTHGRAATYFGRRDQPVVHVDFTRPYCEKLRARLLESASAAGERAAAGGTYAATQGPRLETAAEIDRLERDGADMVGMTGMPEAVLARELGLCYAAIAVVVNHAAGRGASARAIDADAMAAVLRAGIARVCRVLEKLVLRDGH